MTEKPELGKIVATVHIHENGITLSEFSKRHPPSDKRVQLLAESLMERYVREWPVVKNFTDDDLKKWEHDGNSYNHYYSLTEPASLAMANILRQKESLDEIAKAYR
jgi:hypothetical protein